MPAGVSVAPSGGSPFDFTSELLVALNPDTAEATLIGPFGKTSQITHDDRGIFAGLSNPVTATRYHSLAAVHLPEVLEESAHSEDGVVQGIRHKELPITGVQFHPESVMTTEGKALLRNFLDS